MHKNANAYKNELVVYRRRMRYSQKQVAWLLGHRNASMLSRYESGRSLPPLLTALRLEIIYRTPVAFLYAALYREFKQQIRAKEDQMATGTQLRLF